MSDRAAARFGALLFGAQLPAVGVCVLRMAPMQKLEHGRRWRPFIVALTLWLAGACPALSEDGVFLREMLRIPVPGAGVRGLEAMLVRPAGEGRYPLALINHGSPRSAEERPNMTPLAFLPQATEFARR